MSERIYSRRQFLIKGAQKAIDLALVGGTVSGLGWLGYKIWESVRFPEVVEAEVSRSERIPGTRTVRIYSDGRGYGVNSANLEVFESFRSNSDKFLDSANSGKLPLRIVFYDESRNEAVFNFKSRNGQNLKIEGNNNIFLVDQLTTVGHPIESLIRAREILDPDRKYVLPGVKAGRYRDETNIIFRNIRPEGEYLLVYNGKLIGYDSILGASGFLVELPAYKFSVPKVD